MRFPTAPVLLLAAICAVTVTSCTKKYTCQCAIKYSGTPGLPDSTTNEYRIYNTKSEAEKLCKEESYEKTQNGIKVTETCKLY